jgi:hypothetical protein
VAKVKSPLVELRFPVGGINRNAGFDQTPPYCTPYAVNVRSYDIVNLTDAQMHGQRQRGGARPCLAKYLSSRCGTGPFQLLNFATLLEANGQVANYLVGVVGGTLYQSSSGSMASVSGTLNTSGVLQGAQLSQYFYVADYRQSSIQSPANAPDGTIASGNQLSASSISDWTALSINTSLDVVFINPNAPIGNIDGLIQNSTANVFPITAVHTGYIQIDGTLPNQSGGVVWQIGRLPKVFDPTKPTAALTSLCGSMPLPNYNYSTGTVTSTNGIVVLTGGTWAGVPAPTAANMLTLTIPNVSGIGTQQYLVASLTDDTDLVLVDQTTDANCSGQPYILSWMSPTPGLPPLNCPLCCAYNGRIVWAGWPAGVWYMSRQGFPQDYDYGYDPGDPTRAVGGEDANVFQIPEPLTALMPHSDQYLIFACDSSLWILNGDPGYGGKIVNLSREVGVMGPNAWCTLPDGSMIILSRDGIYQIPYGGGSAPVSLSRPQLPVELLNVDYLNNAVNLVYDLQARGVHIFITPTAGTAGQHWFFDLVLGRFWPVVMPNGMQPTAAIDYTPGASTATQVVLGGYDGYLRYFDPTATTDDGTDLVSVVVYGPFRFGGPGYVGEILQIAADLDPNGQGVDWGIFTGETSQEAVQAAVTAAVASGAPWNGSFAAGANHRDYPQAPGPAHTIMLSGSYQWAIEGLRIEPRKRGPIR